MTEAKISDRGYPIYIAVLAALAAAKGLRLPSLWAATQAQIDYSVGFTKRGLVGEAATLLHFPLWHYKTFAITSYIVLILALFLLASLIRRNFDDAEYKNLLQVFVSSMALTYLVHIVGYLDILLLLLTLVALSQRRTWAAIVAEVCVCLIGPFIHEMFLLSFFGVLLFRIAFDATQQSGRERTLLILRACWLAAIVGLVTLLVVQPRPMTSAEIENLKEGINSRADFSVRADFFDVMRRSLSDNIGAASATSKTLSQFGAFFSLTWVALFFIFCSIRRINANAIAHKTLVCGFAVAASIAPMFLQIVGWDLYRWYMLSVFTSFLVFTVIVSTTKHAGQRLNPYLLSTLVAVNLCTGVGLFDGYRVNEFPYTDNISGLIREYQQYGGIRLPKL